MTDRIEKGSGNIYVDLGLEDADEMLAKAKLASCIIDEIEKRGLTQNQVTQLLGTNESNISKLKSGRELRLFTFDQLFNWLNRLDHKVTIQISHHKKGEPYLEVRNV